MSPPKPYLQQYPKSALSVLALTELAYEAATEPHLWPRWFAELATNVGHRVSNVVVHGFGPTRYISLETPEAGFAVINPGRVFENKALSRGSFALAWVRDEIVDEWSQLRRDGSAPTSVEVFTDESRSLRRTDRLLLRAVLPHLQRALTVHFRLEASQGEHNIFGACLDEFSTGMLLLDRHAALLHANRAALDYLGGQCGVVQDDGKLRVLDRDTDTRFRARLKTALSSGGRCFSCLHLDCGATLWLRGLSGGRAVAYISTVRQERPLAPALLADAFGFTPAEARVGSLFARGENVDEIAGKLGVTTHTVRLHIKKMQCKTGTHRQATLIRHMLETIPQVNP